jgi:microcystin-dependent protein
MPTYTARSFGNLIDTNEIEDGSITLAKLDASAIVGVPIGSIIPWLKTFVTRDSGTTDGDDTNALIDAGQNFESTVSVGDVVHNTSDDTFAYVTEVTDNENLLLDADIMDAAETYIIYATPALPDNFVECDGSVLNDANSRYNGATLPDLNGANTFLKGASTSGITGGEDTHTLTINEMPAHKHAIYYGSGGSGYADGTATNANTYDSESAGGGLAHNNIPAYYSVVFIMRIY